MIKIKGMNPHEKIGPLSRIVFAFLALFAPRVLLLGTVKAFLAHVGSLDEDTLKKLIMEIQDV
jgi:hypothetical protein